MTLEDDRKLFKEAAVTVGYDVSQHSTGFFLSPATASAWYLWKVARGTE